MTRKQPRRTSAKLQLVLVHYLTTQTSMGFNCRTAQIAAAAKKIQRSGSLPAPVVKMLEARRAA